MKILLLKPRKGDRAEGGARNGVAFTNSPFEGGKGDVLAWDKRHTAHDARLAAEGNSVIPPLKGARGMF